MRGRANRLDGLFSQGLPGRNVHLHPKAPLRRKAPGRGPGDAKQDTQAERYHPIVHRNPRDIPAVKSNSQHSPRACGVWRPLLVSICLVSVSPPAFAVQWQQCGGPLALPQAPAPLPGTEPGKPETVHIESDEADLSREGVSSLSGNVHLQRGARHLEAERLVYEHETEEASAEGSVEFWAEGLYIAADRAEIGLAEERAIAERARFMLRDAHAHGGAQRISLQGRESLLVEDGHYTTCNPGDDVWVLEAGEIDIDREEQVGVARDVWVRVHGVPVFYAPVLTFPLSDERKSGLLPPTLGVSDASGLELGVDYYLNLAPNRDATLGARWLQKRGALASGEYRYLMPWGRGRLSGEYMPEDRKYGGDRGALGLRHLGSFASGWSADVDYQWTSDSDYFEDFGTSLGESARSHLPQRADLVYAGPGFRIRGRIQDYQTLDDLGTDNLPYARLPQILAMTRLPERNRQINFAGAVELARFERDTGVTGNRADLRSSLHLPLRSPSAFLVPKLGLRLTHYDLSGTAPGADETPSRMLPTFSVDGGLVYERNTTFASQDLVQTLEPRAYYLLVPSTRQDDQPLFDTGYASLDFGQLFRENRFNGADRVGDANQLTLGVTSRLLSPTRGAELARASVGQIYYFRDREVTLPGLAPDDDSVSDLIAEATMDALHPFRLRAALHWDPDESRSSRLAAGLRYQPEHGRAVNAGYRFLRADPSREQDELEQVDLSFAWPLGWGWRAIGRVNYAIGEGRNIESFAGLEHDGCCLALRAVAGRHLSGRTGDYTNAVFLNFEFKGLGGAGTPGAGAALRGISGYEDPF